MRLSILFSRRAFFHCFLLTFAALTLLAAATPCPAQTPLATRLEEDWELVIGEPAPNNDAPQVTCVISPLGNVESTYAAFLVNHHDVPSFAAGGLQLQAWNGKQLLASKEHPNRGVLNTAGETIRWTQSMRIINGNLVVEVLGGTSTTWGGFGGDGTLKITVPTELASLNAYDPAVSVKHSDVVYAANRVHALTLQRIRFYAGDELIAEDATARPVIAPPRQ